MALTSVVTHRTADTPKEVTLSSIRKRSRSTTAFPNAYIERQQITARVAQPATTAGKAKVMCCLVQDGRV
ncbi:hypothetical protein Tco_0633765 [Tanacetum coccineum]